MDTANFSRHFAALPRLVKTLVEDGTEKFKVSCAGRLSVLRAGRWRSSGASLDLAAVQALADEICARGGQAVMGPWFLRVFAGIDGMSVFGERRLELPANSPEAGVQEELQRLAQRGATGVIAGPVGVGKGDLLVWVAAQLAGRETVFVSDTPPHALSAGGVMHVYPPASARERRALGRLLRAHDCVVWDQIDHPDDLRLLVSGLDTHSRWMTLDANDAADLAGRLRHLVAPLGELALACCVFVGPEKHIISSLVTRSTAWVEHVDDAGGVRAALDSLGGLIAPSPGLSKPAEGDAMGLDTAASAAIISPKRAGKSGPYRAVDGDGSALPSPARAPITSNSGMSLDELLMSDAVESSHQLRQSGEIDLEAFVRARNAGAPPPPLRIQVQEDGERPARALGLPAPHHHARTQVVDGAQVDQVLAQVDARALSDEPADAFNPFEGVDFDKLSPPVRGETTALTPVDMNRIRESARDDLSWLLSEDARDDSVARRPQAPPRHHTPGADRSGLDDADPAPTDEILDARDDNRAD